LIKAVESKQHANEKKGEAESHGTDNSERRRATEASDQKRKKGYALREVLPGKKRDQKKDRVRIGKERKLLPRKVETREVHHCNGTCQPEMRGKRRRNTSGETSSDGKKDNGNKSEKTRALIKESLKDP